MKKRKPTDIIPILQSEDSESGLVAIIMIANHLGHDLDLPTMRRRYPGAGTRGLSLKDVQGIGIDLQIQSRVTDLPIDKIMGVRVPAVLQFTKNQFVVFSGFEKGRAIIFNPASGKEYVSIKEFSQKYTGTAIELVRAPGFIPERARTQLKLAMIAGDIKGLYKSFFILILACITVFSLSFIMPFYSMLVIDEAVSSKDITLLNSLFIAAIVVGVLQGATEYFRDKFIAYIGGQFSFQSNSNLVKHILDIPMSFFESRHAADVLSRLDAMEDIKVILTETIPKLIVDAVILLSIISLLFIYSWMLASIVVGFSVISVLWRVAIIFPFMQAKAQFLEFKAKESANLMETIRGIQSIKLYGIEAERLNVWNRVFTKKTNTDIKADTFVTWWTSLDRFGTSLENVIILFIGAWQVLEGHLTLGILLCFIGYKDRFVTQFIGFVTNIFVAIEIPVYLARLSDIIVQEEEDYTNLDNDVALTGQIEVKNLKFRFSSSEPFLFDNLCINIQRGDSVAIIGPSGSGKSTLLKIMLGLIEPHSGNVTVDDLNIKTHKRAYRNVISTVMQDDCLLSGTILENITFFDKKPDLNWAMEVARMACIHDEISNMAQGYQTWVSDFSSNISGGQKQRVLIARALYRKPKIMFMDEATSALDVKNEKKVNDGLKKLGLTRIIIAHRPETINSADKVYALEAGRLVFREKSELPANYLKSS